MVKNHKKRFVTRKEQNLTPGAYSKQQKRTLTTTSKNIKAKTNLTTMSKNSVNPMVPLSSTSCIRTSGLFAILKNFDTQILGGSSRFSP